MAIKCLDFHREEWDDVRPIRRFFVVLRSGRRFKIWAHDATDARESVDSKLDPVVMYGSF